MRRREGDGGRVALIKPESFRGDDGRQADAVSPAIGGDRSAGERRLPIGVFARLTHLTRKALKTYERYGLLSPAAIDPETHYRFYGLEQVRDAETIRLLRSVGVPLRDIAAVLGDESGASLTDLLRRRRTQLASVLAATDRLLTKLEAAPPTSIGDAIAILDVPAYAAAMCDGVCTYETHEAMVDWLLEDLAALIARSGIRTLGRETATYFAEFDLTHDYRVEVSVPIDFPLEPGGALPPLMRRVPDATVVSCVHEGPYAEQHSSFARLVSWAAGHNLPLTGRFSETYLVDERDTDDPDLFRTLLSLTLVTPTGSVPTPTYGDIGGGGPVG